MTLWWFESRHSNKHLAFKEIIDFPHQYFLLLGCKQYTHVKCSFTLNIKYI